MPMNEKTIHLLHLGEGILRWVTLAPGSDGPAIRSRGELRGPAERALEEWFEKNGGAGGDIRLYDSRPMYFSFDLTLPRKARGQLAGIIGLRVRQELGLGEDAVLWTAQLTKARGAAGSLAAHVIVARRQMLSDVAAWRERHALAGLWVGPDLLAIDALTAAAGTEAGSLLLVDHHDDHAVYYLAQAGEAPCRGVIGLHGGGVGVTTELWPVADGRRPARFHFGDGDRATLLAACPELADLPEAPAVVPSNASHAPRWSALAGELAGFDPVLLGGVAQWLSGAAPGLSLLRAPEGETAAGAAQRSRTRAWAMAVLLLALLLALSLGRARQRRLEAGQRLLARAGALRPVIERLRQDEATLQRIAADHKTSLLPALEAMHRAAPQGMQLQSLGLSQTGQLKLQGIVPAPPLASQFFSEMAGAAPFAPGRVQLSEVKQSEGKVTFQLTAQIKGRAKR